MGDGGTAEKTDWSVYDRPELIDSVSARAGSGRCEALVMLDGMHCASCAARVQGVLREFDAQARVSLASKTAEISWDDNRARLSNILDRLEQAGFAPRILARETDNQSFTEQRRAAIRRIGVAILCSMQVMMLAWPSYFHVTEMTPAVAALLRYAQWLFATPVVIYSGWPFLQGAAAALSKRVVNMDVPVALALVVAYLASAWRTIGNSGAIYFDTATMFVLLLSVGRYLEDRTRAVAGERLRLLAGQRALTASRVTKTGIEKVAISALNAGDRVLISSGEAVPVDGKLIEQAADMDESLLTGEATPVVRHSGDRVLAGSVNVGTAAVTIGVTRVGAATQLSQITRLLQRAQSERPPFVQLADRIAGGFSVAVLALAAAAAWYWAGDGADRSLSVALAVLVASCPCALALAVPAVFAAASSRLAAHGVLVARVQALSRLPDVDTVIFDKTGTLTRNEFEVRAVHPLTRESADQCLHVAAALELGGIHPIARAFVRVATPLKAQDVHHYAGCGVHGCVGGRSYWLGAPDSSPTAGATAQIAAHIAESPHLTWIVLSADKPLALFGLTAIERPEAREIIRDLAQSGIVPELLSGDAGETARHLGRHLGISSVRARQNPTDKLTRVQELQNTRHVVMAVGDGVNDAPLLAAADVSVAMPAGAPLAQARADVILIGDTLKPLPLLIRIGVRTRQLIRQNIAWALVYNLAILPLAASGALTPWLAALGMSVSSLLVVANALRVAAPLAAEDS